MEETYPRLAAQFVVIFMFDWGLAYTYTSTWDIEEAKRLRQVDEIIESNGSRFRKQAILKSPIGGGHYKEVAIFVEYNYGESNE